MVNMAKLGKRHEEKNLTCRLKINKIMFYILNFNTIQKLPVHRIPLLQSKIQDHSYTISTFLLICRLKVTPAHE